MTEPCTNHRNGFWDRRKTTHGLQSLRQSRLWPIMVLQSIHHLQTSDSTQYCAAIYERCATQRLAILGGTRLNTEVYVVWEATKK